mmetsp:Transcript_163815/g.520662  ORF Transcript_163815/g.520662 Transcript_163815/m.520662 type:complete len:347 (+) Transcript_163815:55-1095(+)
MVRIASVPVVAAAAVSALLALCANGIVVADADEGNHHHHKHHHHGHHHKHHNHADDADNATVVAKPVAAHSAVQAGVSQASIMQKLKAMEKTLDSAAAKVAKNTPPSAHGKLSVNSPLPMDFADLFSEAVAAATGCDAREVKVTGAVPVKGDSKLDEIDFQASSGVISAIMSQAADPSSKLANGLLHSFLVADSTSDSEQASEPAAVAEAATVATAATAKACGDECADPAAPLANDMQMPYGDLEPFGREDTAQELTEASITESDAMVDQLERAEVAEEKRAVFRALTRLRGAAITSFDGVARAHTGNVDEFARKTQWRKQHPIMHLANEEADVSRWAFPSGETNL